MQEDITTSTCHSKPLQTPFLQQQTRTRPLFVTHYLQSHFQDHFSQQRFEENWFVSIFLQTFNITVNVDCASLDRK